MDEHPSTGTRGDTLPDWLKQAVADSERRQARLARSTPAEAKARADYYRREHENYLWLSAEKRTRGTGDCSREAGAASRMAAAAVSAAVRPRERRDHGGGNTTRRNRAGRSSARSGDSGSDDGGSEPPPPGEWHWTQPAAWQPRAVENHRYARSNRARQLVAA
jgi:hypothetical protein